LKFELALRLGRTVAELEASMSLEEFMDWLAWDSVSPIGDERCFDLPGAMQRQVQIALARSKRPPDLDSLLPFRQQKPVTLESFFGSFIDGPAAS
jgi:hypothetical protein